MITIRKLIWNSRNVSHIARHNIVPTEVEEVCHGLPIILRGQIKNRLLLVGPTEEKRMLTVVLEPKGKRIYYPVTAYPADYSDISLYVRMKGGGDNEKNETNK